MTSRQWQIAALVAEGMKNAEIGKVLGVTEQAIKNRLRAMYDATGMSTRTELAVWYVTRKENHAGDISANS